MANPRSVAVFMSIGSGTTTSFLNTLPPQHVVSLTHSRVLGEKANSLNATLIDAAAFNLETKILLTPSGTSGFKLLSYQYGYAMTHGQMSAIYSGYLYDYKPTIAGNTRTLELIALSQETTSSTNTITETYGVDSAVRVSDIVKQIASKNNWIIGTIEETIPVNRVFTQGYKSPMEFINQDLIPFAVSAVTGNGGYAVSFTTSITGKTVVNFKSITVTTPVNSYTKINGQSGRYIYNNAESTVLSWSPKVLGAVLLSGASAVSSQVMLESTGDTYKADAVSNISNSLYTGNRQWLAANQYKTLAASSASKEEADSAVRAQQSRAMNFQYQAVATVLGDPTLTPGDTVEFNIITDYNQLHYSSGLYVAYEVNDNIGIAGFTTDMQLMKNASWNGSNLSGATTTAQTKAKQAGWNRVGGVQYD